MPSVLQEVTLEETHNLLKNSKNQKCLLLLDGCSFNDSSKNKIFIIGDSHAATLAFDLKKIALEKDYNFITSFLGDCGFFPGFNLIDSKSKKIDNNCNNKYFNKLLKKIKSHNNSIIIISARFPLYLSNQEISDRPNKDKYVKWKRKYVPIDKFQNISSSFKSTLNEISKKNRVIFVYPTPENEVHVPRKLFNKYLRGNLNLNEDSDNKDFISIPYADFQNRTKETFELFDSIKGENIYRVYPHKLFCNTLITNECIAHDYQRIFYFDNNHLSIDGANIVVKLITDQINKINLK